MAGKQSFTISPHPTCNMPHLHADKTKMIEPPYDFDRPMPWPIRLMLACAGLFSIIMPAYEFRHVFFHPSLLTVFFAAITLGAWTVGGSVLLAAVAGAGQKWRFADGKLTVSNQNLFKHWDIAVTGSAIVESNVRTNDSSDGPDTYSIVLQLKDGTKLETHGLDTPEAAERFHQRILAYLQQD